MPLSILPNKNKQSENGQHFHWIDDETGVCHFKDKRLGARFKVLLSQLSESTAESIPWACQDWASSKAAYRFFDNDRVTEQEILAGHFMSTKSRFDETDSTILVLHDTTQLSYKRENVGLLGKLHRGTKHGEKWTAEHPLCGILMHSSMVVTPEGLPLGIAAIKFWTRKEFKDCNALKRVINPTRVPIEEKESIRWIQNVKQSSQLLKDPQRCVHIGDRESDIYELFCMAQEENTNFLVRTCVNRTTGDGNSTVEQEMKAALCMGKHKLEIKDSAGKISEASLEIKVCKLNIRPPEGKQKRYPALELTVIHAVEIGVPQDREPIIWKLLTNLAANDMESAVKMLTWYAMRWKIEVFHKVLKSGMKVEESGLRTAERLVNLIATCSILAWRIFWITMIGRSKPKAPPSIALTQQEIEVLDRAVKSGKSNLDKAQLLPDYIIKIAKLGGYLGRANDPAPGNIVMWRGLSRLADIIIGFEIASKDVGN